MITLRNEGVGFWSSVSPSFSLKEEGESWILLTIVSVSIGRIYGFSFFFFTFRLDPWWFLFRNHFKIPILNIIWPYISYGSHTLHVIGNIIWYIINGKLIPSLVILVEICLFAYSYVFVAYLVLKMAIQQSFFSNSFSYILLEHFPMQFLEQSKYDRYPRRAFWIDLPNVEFHESDDPVPSIYKDELFAELALKQPLVILCYRVTVRF